MKQSATLYNAQQGHVVWSGLWPEIKAYLMAGHKLRIEVKPATRSSEQNALLHAMLTDIAKTKEWAGKRRDVETWKRLCTAAWLRARGEQVEFLPALDGHGVDIVFRRTSELSVAECSELVDWIGAWCAENGIETERETA